MRTFETDSPEEVRLAYEMGEVTRRNGRPADIIQTNVFPPEEVRTLKDSGARQNFETGAVRDTATGKGRYDLLPPAAILAVARIFEDGAVKYDARNWEKGIPLSRFMDSGLRHLFKHLEGHRDERHIVQAAWNILAYIWTATQIERGQLPEILNDLPNHLGKEKASPL